MSKFLRLRRWRPRSPLALTATAAAAARSAPTANATAKARIFQSADADRAAQNLDLGMIVLTGAGAYTATVEIDKAGTFNCDGGSGNVTCSGTPTAGDLQCRAARKARP